MAIKSNKICYKHIKLPDAEAEKHKSRQNQILLQMKKILILCIAFSLAMSFNSCKKEDDKTNYFSFKGVDYTIDEKALVELVFNQGTADEVIMHVFLFSNNKENDTTTLMLTLLDNESNILSGNYTAIDQGDDAANRGIVPFAFFSLSGILFQDESYFLTGAGGSMDVSVSGTEYDISLNNIAAGNYGDLFDNDPADGNHEFAKTGEIKGNYNGVIVKETEVIGSNKSSKLGRIKQLIEEKLK
jgi:hypothetical protein